MTFHTLLFWSMAIPATIVMTLITVSLLRLQFNPSESTDAPERLHHNLPLEIIWAMLPVITLAGLLWLTYLAL